jgi:hypothetical protein
MVNAPTEKTTREPHMPTSTYDYTAAAQQRSLDLLRQSQDAVVDLVGNWAQAVDNAAPERPAIPVIAGLPTSSEVLQTSFGFAGQVLAAQRAFAENLLRAMAPAVKTQPVSTPVA